MHQQHGSLGISTVLHSYRTNYVAISDVGALAIMTWRPTRWPSFGLVTTMSAPITKDKLSFTLGDLTYIDPSFDDDALVPRTRAAKHPIATWFAHLFAKFAEWQRRRAVIQEMAMMSDRELADIGLTRSDLARVFDPDFVAAHARGRDYIAY